MKNWDRLKQICCDIIPNGKLVFESYNEALPRVMEKAAVYIFVNQIPENDDIRFLREQMISLNKIGYIKED